MATNDSISDTAAQIANSFPDDVDLDPAAVEDRLDSLINEFDVPRDEAARATRSHFCTEYDLDVEDLATAGGSGQDRGLASIQSGDQWLSTTAKVLELWEPGHASIAQVGLIGDETGTCKLTIWESADARSVAENEVYRFENVVSDVYQGTVGIQVNSASSLEPADADVDIDVGETDARVTGALVAVQPGSGLIKRCPDEDCTRVLQNGRCSEHGSVEGEFDLRIKAVIDDGETAYDVIFDREATETVTDLSLGAATDRAMEALDKAVVTDEIRDRVLGRYYRVTGPTVGQYLLVDACTPVATGHDEADVCALRERLPDG